ncbi:hypothetical protein D3C80_1846950 [compost metagenome]
MVGGQLVIDAIVGITEFHCTVAAVVLGHFLFDDIGTDGGRNVVGLAGQIGAGMIIDAILIERRVT